VSKDVAKIDYSDKDTKELMDMVVELLPKRYKAKYSWGCYVSSHLVRVNVYRVRIKGIGYVVATVPCRILKKIKTPEHVRLVADELAYEILGSDNDKALVEGKIIEEVKFE